jgi:hypothetical protein
MSKIKPSTKELKAIDKYENMLKKISEVKQFKEGDYFIAMGFIGHDEDGEFKYGVLTNSYGAAIKYIVVHVTPHGIPFAKKLNSVGNPVGPIISMIGPLVMGDGDIDYFDDDVTFQLDPDFAEAIILDSASEYDPTHVHKNKKNLFNEIVKHNKSLKIDTHDAKSVNEFFLNINVGNLFWQSPNSFFLVKNKTVETKNGTLFKKVNGWSGRCISKVAILTVEDKKGNEKIVCAADYVHKALYSQQPRSYKELKN